MIDDRTLDAAVAAGVIDAGTRARLDGFARDHARGTAGADEESFRLLTGFNDIFVSIAIGLVLFAVASLVGRVAPVLAAFALAGTSWGLAEYFTRARRMALPSVVLLLAFVASIFAGVAALTSALTPVNAVSGGSFGGLAATIAAAAAAYFHWRRFHVPITVAAGAAALGGTLVALTSMVVPGVPALVSLAVLVAGLAVFALAMAFDARDRARVTRWSDVAFWLHLLAAPAIIHPVFALTGLAKGATSPGAAVAVAVIYLVLTVVALAIDRRALLVSALFYVIYAIQALVTSGVGVDASFGATALVLGGFLVLLSAAWRPIRAAVVARLPGSVRDLLPVAG